MKIEIKNRWSGSVLFECEVPDDMEERFRMRFAVELAVRQRANLRAADLSAADLRDADLRAADLQPIRDDIWAVLSSAPAEVPALIEALKAGRVDGSTYTGECSCLVGTIATARGIRYDNLGSLKPSSSRPAERFFMNIRKGDTPETNQASALALQWAEEWLATITTAFPPKAA